MSVRPLRLLMTADAVGGVWTYAIALAEALQPLGIQTTIALLGPAPTEAALAMLPDHVTLLDTGLPIDWLADGPHSVRAAASAVARLSADFDLAQLNSPTLAIEGSFKVPVVSVMHGCLATWWEAAEASPLPTNLAWQAELARAGLRHVDAIVTPTRAFADAVQRCYGLVERPIAIPNGRLPLPLATPATDAAPVLTAGRLWDRVKSTRFLDRVAARLPVPFAAAGPITAPQGDCVDVKALRPLSTLGDAALSAQLAARPVFVSAATFEPFGLAVLEAAQAGCPLVLSDIPSFRELWDGAAAFVSPGNEDGFVEAITALLADPEHHARSGQSAAAHARRYTPAATALAMSDLFTHLLERRAAA